MMYSGRVCFRGIVILFIITEWKVGDVGRGAVDICVGFFIFF